MNAPFEDPEGGYASLVDLLCWRACVHPDREAFLFLVDGQAPGPRLTFADLELRARSLAVTLQELNASGERALLLYPPGLDFFVAFCGCLLSGTVSIPAPPPDALRLKRTLPRLQSIADDARATLVLTTSGLLGKLDEYRAHLPSLGQLGWLATDALDESRAGAWSPPRLDGSTLAYL